MAGTAAAQRLRGSFSSRAFLRGLAVVTALYALLALWIVLNAGKTLDRSQSRMPSQTVIVEWDEAEEALPAMVHADVYGPNVPLPPDGEDHGYEPDVAQPAPMESGLAAAPVDGLYEQAPNGAHLPIVRTQDGLTPFQAYRRPFDVYATPNPVVALAIAGLGLSDIATETAVRPMPPDISFILSPYAPAPDFWIRESRARGHEVWFSLPLETDTYPRDDPGPHTLLVSAPERENLAKLDWILSRADGYVGLVTGPHPAFMQSAGDMRPAIGAIYHRGLGFVDGSADPGLIPHTMAAGMKAPYATVDIWIDDPDPSQEAIDAALARLEQTARDKGVAAGVIHALPVSYQKILKWVETLPQKGLSLAPLSATTGL